MSRYFSDKYKRLVPYVPGEQPKNNVYIKLNTNENPFPPPDSVTKAVESVSRKLNLYSDPDETSMRNALAEFHGLEPDNFIVTNGSDEVLNFAFMAFCDSSHDAVFPDITYGFYPVFADVNNIEYQTIPLDKDFNVDVSGFCGVNKTVFIANPNAPTGIALLPGEIETIIKSNPDSVVVIDEAYVDFGAKSVVDLVSKYDNLLVTRTFSKSGFLAGGRLGYGIASRDIISDLNALRNSTNPYNVNSMTLAAGEAVLKETEYTNRCIEIIKENRMFITEKLKKMGFTVLDSKANFIFVKHPDICGEDLYLDLKASGILVRHFRTDRIKEFNRITIGTRKDMEILADNIERILLKSR